MAGAVAWPAAWQEAWVNMMDYAEGNFDTEGGGGSQMFDVPVGDTPFGNTDTEARSPHMDYYRRLGSQLRNAMQPQQAQAPAPMQGPSQSPMQLGGGSLTSGFDQNWLMNQTNAGSANGAKIG